MGRPEAPCDFILEKSVQRIKDKDTVDENNYGPRGKAGGAQSWGPALAVGRLTLRIPGPPGTRGASSSRYLCSSLPKMTPGPCPASWGSRPPVGCPHRGAALPSSSLTSSSSAKLGPVRQGPAGDPTHLDGVLPMTQAGAWHGTTVYLHPCASSPSPQVRSR